MNLQSKLKSSQVKFIQDMSQIFQDNPLSARQNEEKKGSQPPRESRKPLKEQIEQKLDRDVSQLTK